MHIINYYSTIHKFGRESLYQRLSTFLRDIQPPWVEISARFPARIWRTEEIGTFGSEIGSSFVPISYASVLFLPNHILRAQILEVSTSTKYRNLLFLQHTVPWYSSRARMCDVESVVPTDHVYCTLGEYLLTINTYNN